MPRSPYKRSERVGHLIQSEIADIAKRDLKDPRVSPFVAVTRVDLTDDLRHARIYLSVYGTEEERDSTLAGFARASGFIRGELGRRLTLRRVPQLEFRLDRGIEHSDQIDRLLRGLHEEQQQPDGEGGGSQSPA